jgi:dTDP-4-dehydrorhamnose reductase
MELIKKRLLIFGSNGKLGSALARFYSRNSGFEILCSGNEEHSLVENVEYIPADITKRNSVKNIFHKFFPDFVINAAGFTNVDACESNKELSWNANVKGTESIAMSSWAIDSHLVYISSDYVFDGKEGPYTEDDIPHPISYYGRTKLAAENAVRTSGTKFTIIRTNVLYGSGEKNRPDFASWVIDSLSKGKEIKIVTDQYNNPAFIDDLVDGINKTMDNSLQGIYNIAGDEVVSRYEFTLRLARYFNLDESLIKPIVTADLKQPAPRPLKSGLIITKAVKEADYKPCSIEKTFEVIKGRYNY